MSPEQALRQITEVLDRYLACPIVVVVNGNRAELRTPTVQEIHRIFDAIAVIRGLIPAKGADDEQPENAAAAG